MQNTLVVTADGSRARIFLYREHVDGGTRRQRFALVAALDEPDGRRKGSELFSDRVATARIGASIHAGTDDHRDDHVARIERGFARRIADTLRDQLASQSAARLIVAASPGMLGRLREFLDAAARDVERVEIDRDLSSATASILHGHLAERGHLPTPAPARKVPLGGSPALRRGG